MPPVEKRHAKDTDNRGGNPRLVSTLHAGVYSRTSRPPHRPPPSGALVSEEQFCELLLIPC